MVSKLADNVLMDVAFCRKKIFSDLLCHLLFLRAIGFWIGGAPASEEGGAANKLFNRSLIQSQSFFSPSTSQVDHYQDWSNFYLAWVLVKFSLGF